MSITSIASVNSLPWEEKEAIYRRFIPRILIERFGLAPNLIDAQGRTLLRLRCERGQSDVILDLRHQAEAQDALLYAHLADTVNAQIHVLLYVVNDPYSPRFDVDRMADGSPTRFGVLRRNIPAEVAAMEAGLAPGQVRRGLRILQHSIAAFEDFVGSLGHEIYFIEPLAYHNAVVFERYGFSYLKGRDLMQSVNAGFQPGARHCQQLDGSSPFRQPCMADSIRGRSWAIHDGVLGHPFTDVTQYKRVGVMANEVTFAEGVW